MLASSSARQSEVKDLFSGTGEEGSMTSLLIHNREATRAARIKHQGRNGTYDPWKWKTKEKCMRKDSVVFMKLMH